jgi:hypothetical protein
MAVSRRRIAGAILKVPLGDGWHSYAWTMPLEDFIFPDARTDRDLPLEEVVARPVLFRVCVHKAAWTTGRWPRVGSIPVPEPIAGPVPSFIQDVFTGKFQIYCGGEIRPSTEEECRGLECAAVWDPDHVEDRIRDHYAGVPCKWLSH